MYSYNCMNCAHPVCPMKNKADHYCGNYMAARPFTLKLEGKRASLSDADLSDADLRYASLSDADLSDADLSGADLDYSCLPLWCGSLKTHFDDKQLVQIAYHLVKSGLQSKNASEETKKELSKLIDFANKFHRVGECGEITY